MSRNESPYGTIFGHLEKAWNKITNIIATPLNPSKNAILFMFVVYVLTKYWFCESSVNLSQKIIVANEMF